MLSTPARFQPLLKHHEHAYRATLVFRGDELLLRDDHALPEQETCQEAGVDAERIYPVGILDERYYQTAWVAPDANAPAGHAFRKLRQLLFLNAIDQALAAIACRAYQIAEWARTHRFCGACGTPTALLPGERCMTCP
jgi:NAD+ diphosphatase